MSQLSPVAFHGDTIYCVNHNNEPYTAVRPIIENMGLAWQAQYDKLTSSNRWGVMNIMTPSNGGAQKTLCMPVRKLPALLASINPKKVKPELRERIELYQAECDDALWQYWTEGQATRPAAEPAPDPDDRLSKRSDPERKALTSIIGVWVGLEPQRHSVARKQVNANFGVTTVDCMTVGQVREAIQWVQGRIDTLQGLRQQALESGNSEQAVNVKLSGIDDKAMKTKDMHFKDIEEIISLLKVNMSTLNTFGRGKGWRRMDWSDEKQALYDNLQDGVSMALAGMEMARLGLCIAAKAHSAVGSEA